MLLIVSIKIMILHTDRILPTSRPFKLLPLTAAARFAIGKNYLDEATTLGCEHTTFGARGITLRMMSSAGVYRRKVSRAGCGERPDG
jgi:hypothetical protein